MSPSGSLDYRKKQAKKLLRAVAAREHDALHRVQKNHPQFPHAVSDGGCTSFLLAHAQLVIARENGFKTWPEMKAALEAQAPSQEVPYETALATVKSEAFRAAPEEALRKAAPLIKDSVFIKDILSIVQSRPWMLEPEHTDWWDAILWELFFARDYGEYMPDDD